MLEIIIHVDAPAHQAIGIKEDLAQYVEQYGDTRVVSIVEKTSYSQTTLGEKQGNV